MTSGTVRFVHTLYGMPSYQLGYVLPEGKEKARLMAAARHEYQTQTPMSAPLHVPGTDRPPGEHSVYLDPDNHHCFYGARVDIIP